MNSVNTHAGGLEELYFLYRADLLRFLAARTGDPAEAEEIVQELWFKVRSARSGPIAHGRAYLYRMAQNLVLDRLRERQRRARRDMAWSEQTHGPATQEGEVADEGAGTQQAIEAREELACLQAAIEALPRKAQLAFRLHKIDGLSHGEVAARMGISRSGVEKHMATAMVHLRRALCR